MKNVFCVLSLLLTFLTIHAQDLPPQSQIDSLNQIIDGPKNAQQLRAIERLVVIYSDPVDLKVDSLTLRGLQLARELGDMNTAASMATKQIGFKFRYLNRPELAVPTFEDFYPQLVKVSNDSIKASFLSESAHVFAFSPMPEKSLDLSNEGLEIDGATMLQRGSLHHAKALALSNSGQFAAASVEAQKALELLDDMDITRKIEIRGLLSTLYSRIGLNDLAIEENDAAIKMARELDNPRLLLSFYYNQATNYLHKNDQLNRIESLKNSLYHARRLPDPSIIEPRILGAIIHAHLDADQLETALRYHDTLQSRPPFYIEGPNAGGYQLVLGKFAFAKADYQTAIEKFEKARPAIMSSPDYYDKIEFLTALKKFYKAAGKYRNQAVVADELATIKDSILNVQRTQGLTFYQTKYEQSKRDATIAAQRDEISYLDAQKRIRDLWLLLGAVGLITIFGIVFFIRHRKTQQEKQKLQRAFTQDLIQSIESERRRISSQLHDSVGQSLLVLKNNMKQDGDQKDVALMEQTIDEVRNMSHQMHPYQFGELGLMASIDQLVDQLNESSNIFYSFEDETNGTTVDPDRGILIYRMLQESLQNVEKHSHAEACKVTATTMGQTLSITVTDNGNGFDVAAAGMKTLGLQTLEERATMIGAQLTIDSVLNKGTTVTINAPHHV